jgi:Flp pilus assembly protein protease CpaA
MIVATALLGAAAAYDVRHRRVPNALNAVLAAAGLAAAASTAGPIAALDHLGAALLVLALLWWSWSRGQLGAGDVKLAAAAAAWVGLARLPQYLLAVAVLGAATALVVLATRAPAGRRIPYAVAIALGAVGTMWLG